MIEWFVYKIESVLMISIVDHKIIPLLPGNYEYVQLGIIL